MDRKPVNYDKGLNKLKSKIFYVEEYYINYNKFNDDDFYTICDRLFELLPDITIGPEEKIKRLGRLVTKTIMKSKHHKSVRVKLSYIKNRLDELVPNDNLSYVERIETPASIAGIVGRDGGLHSLS